MRSNSCIEVDVLIMGGGIQGLTLLKHFLESGWNSVFLVTRDTLGTGETLHSHGYIHQGYHLPSEGERLIQPLVESSKWWHDWMVQHHMNYASTHPIYFGVSNEQWEERVSSWKNWGLPYEECKELPVALKGGIYSSNLGKVFKIQDRLIPAWRIIETLSKSLQEQMTQGELTQIYWDEKTNKVEICLLKIQERDVWLRPRFLILATGRDTQPLLRSIESSNGLHPFQEKLSELHLIRSVPMLLVKGKALPNISGNFTDIPIFMMTHPLEDGDFMWVITLMENHHTTREDVDSREEPPVDSLTIQKTMEQLCALIPKTKMVLEEVLFSVYFGAKVDHPEGTPTWFIGDGGINNLRFIWPGLWSLAHASSLQLIQELRNSSLLSDPASKATEKFNAKEYQIPVGVSTGEEKRLSSSQKWYLWKEFKETYELKL